MWGVAKTYRPGNVQMCVMVGVFDRWVVLYVLGVACYLLGLGGESGKRKAGRAGIFDFLFLNFLQLKFQAFQLSLFCLFFLFLSALLYWIGSLYYFVRKRE